MRPRSLLAFRFVRALFVVFVGVAAPGIAGHVLLTAAAQALPNPPDAIEMEQTLFVQAPDFAGGGNSIVLVWLPEPLVNTCLGRTMKECFTIDYCIRTTNPNGAQCRNLGIPRAQLPHYPSDMRPRRAMSLVMKALEDTNGFDRLKEFYKRAPASSLSQLALDTQIRAKVRYNDNPSFQSFYLLEVLETP